MAADDRAIKTAVSQSVKDAQAFLLTEDGKKVLEARAMKIVVEATREREREIKAWRGVGKIPKRHTEAEKKKMLREHLEPEAALFVEEQRTLAVLETKDAIAVRRRAILEQEMVGFVFELFVGEALREIALEELKSDPEAKRRVEEETGLFFPDPKGMNFSVYATLSRWWTEEKKMLRANLERFAQFIIALKQRPTLLTAFPLTYPPARLLCSQQPSYHFSVCVCFPAVIRRWGAASVQDRLRLVSDAEKAAARKRLLEASAKKLAESERQAAECAAMWQVGRPRAETRRLLPCRVAAWPLASWPLTFWPAVLVRFDLVLLRVF